MPTFDEGVFGGHFHTANAPPVFGIPGLDVLAYSNGRDWARGLRAQLRHAAAGGVSMLLDSTALLARTAPSARGASRSWWRRATAAAGAWSDATGVRSSSSRRGARIATDERMVSLCIESGHVAMDCTRYYSSSATSSSQSVRDDFTRPSRARAAAAARP